MAAQLRLLKLTPVEAVIECIAPAGAEVRGRLAGPSCLYSTTIEVAHFVRRNRIIIPEPAWWDPQSPFLYLATLEIWTDGQGQGSEQAQIGLRHSIHAGGAIVHNGRRIDLKSQRIERAEESEMKRLKHEGFNAVEVRAAIMEQVCEIANRIGLLVIPDSPVAIDPLRHPSAITS